MTILPLVLSALAATHNAASLTEAEAGFAFDPTAAPTLALGMSPQEESRAAGEASMQPLPAFGVEGARYWYVHGGFAEDIDFDGNQFGLLGVGYEHFIADALSVAIEVNGLVFNQDIEDAAGINFNLLVRWHFLRRRDWSLFIDGGTGLLVSTNDIPAHGSSFNFTPQAGVGFTVDLADELRLLGGLRWHHISNANIYESNPGRDSLYGYVGVMMPF